MRITETWRVWEWGDVEWPQGVFYWQSKCPSDKTMKHDRKGTKHRNVGQLTLKVHLKHFNREERGVQEWLILYLRCLKAVGDYSILNTFHWGFDFQDIQGETVECREKFLIQRYSLQYSHVFIFQIEKKLEQFFRKVFWSQWMLINRQKEVRW